MTLPPHGKPSAAYQTDIPARPGLPIVEAVRMGSWAPYHSACCCASALPLAEALADRARAGHSPAGADLLEPRLRLLERP